MPDEVVQWLGEIDPRVIIDGTYGGGGHARRMLELLPDGEGLVIGLDRDPAVSARVESENSENRVESENSENRVESENNDPRISVFLGSYEQAAKAMEVCEVASADAMVLDLGLSSDQLADRDRGFSFAQNGPLDLRFDPENGFSCAEWLARHSEEQIANAIYQYGEERFSRRIARVIVERQRKREPVKTVDDLVDICRRCVPRSKNHDIHPATRTFQALRIAVNDELGILERTLQSAPEWLRAGGRLAVISFHSLEDRIVKNAFRDDDRWNVLTKKPLRPTEREVALNTRSRSAKMRVAQRR